MGRFLKLGVLISLLVIVGSAYMALRLVFFESPEVQVPAVIGMDAVKAVEALRSQGLVARIDQVDSSQPQGMVVSQWPDPGEKVERGKVVILKASRGGRVVTVPDVRGLEMGEAVKRLSDAGLKVSDVLKVRDGVTPSGKVIAQNPASPASVPSTASVSLLVSQGLEGEDLVEIPDLTGQAVDQAMLMLTQMGLKGAVGARVKTQAFPEGVVVSHLPRMGAKVPPGSTVSLRVAAGGSEGAPSTAVQPQGAPGVTEGAPKAETSTGTSAPKVEQKQEEPKPKEAPKLSLPAGSEGKVEPKEAAKVSGGPLRTAKIRYQVPPLTQPMALKIELVDDDGARVVKEAQVKGGEYVAVDAPFRGEARVVIYLGGEFVWQDRYR
ncbi:MAG: PASTA domain-containing protein [Thermanaerothrix sp.]|nr:PASTA domain-containing protein [Thermanaerothrix sp.]